jgi:branched-chain amino acid transport system substrate-binding protein
MTQAGVHQGVLHYLNAVKSVGSKAPDAVVAKIRSKPVNDMFARNGVLRPDGLIVHDLLLVKVKAPDKSRDEWDLHDALEHIPGNDAFPPLNGEARPLFT